MSEEAHETADGTLYFDGKKCIHSRNCVLSRPDVFVPNIEGEWIHPENANAWELQALADNCPSNAIRFKPKQAMVSAPLVNTVHVRENGPYALKATLQMDGEDSETTRLTLCRCGESKNKPYCDGTHSEINFIATGELPTKISEPLATRNGVVEVNPLPNGPLALKGNVEICAGTGHTIDRTQEVYLCRCGHSSNKPFCDGAHKKIGFTTEV